MLISKALINSNISYDEFVLKGTWCESINFCLKNDPFNYKTKWH